MVAQLHKSSLGTRIFQGIAVAFWLTLFWYVVRGGLTRHLSMRAGALLIVTVAVAGGVGGGAYYGTDRLRSGGIARETIANLIALGAFFVAAFAMLLLVGRWL